jgi:hypothetical protein
MRNAFVTGDGDLSIDSWRTFYAEFHINPSVEQRRRVVQRQQRANGSIRHTGRLSSAPAR